VCVAVSAGSPALSTCIVTAGTSLLLPQPMTQKCATTDEIEPTASGEEGRVGDGDELSYRGGGRGGQEMT
jgi:hypothetical protein